MIDFVKKLIEKYLGGGVILLSPQVVSLLVSLVTLPVVLRSLPINHYGLLQFVLAIQVWVGALSGNHISTGAIRGVARGLDGTILYGFLKRLRFFSLICFSGLIASFVFYLTEHQTFALLLIIIFLYLILGYLSQDHYISFLVAKKNFKQLSLLQIVDSITSLSISALVAYFTHNIILFALTLLGIKAFIYLTTWALTIRKSKIIKAYKEGLFDRECFHYGVRLIPIDIITITAGKISDFLIGYFIGFVHLAVFSVANKLRNKVAEAIRVTPSLLYSDFAKKERRNLIKTINKHLLKISLLGFLLVCGAIIAAYCYIKFFLPTSYHKAIMYFIIISLGLPAGLMAIILHTILESHLRYKELTVIGIIPNLLKIVLILVFGYFWKVIGVCGALAISSWVSFGFYYLLTIRKDLVIGIIQKFPLVEKLSNF
jgi:O-antigen/teichoic acid export membrane protein